MGNSGLLTVLLGVLIEYLLELWDFLFFMTFQNWGNWLQTTIQHLVFPYSEGDYLIF